MEHLNKELAMWEAVLIALMQLPKQHQSNTYDAYFGEVVGRVNEIRRAILHIQAVKKN